MINSIAYTTLYIKCTVLYIVFKYSGLINFDNKIIHMYILLNNVTISLLNS